MKKAVGAILWHCTDFSEDRHRFCPSGKNSWCKFLKDKVTGKTTHKNRINLSQGIFKIIKPIFQDLASNTKSEWIHKKNNLDKMSQNHVFIKQLLKWVLILQSFNSMMEFHLFTMFRYFGFEDGCDQQCFASWRPKKNNKISENVIRRR